MSQILHPHSRVLFYEGVLKWRVPSEMSEPMLNYLVYGFSPGSFYTAVLANDALTAFASSHPSNRMTDLKALAGWIQDCAPAISWGSYERVRDWLALTPEQRRAILEANNLMYTPERETWLTLEQGIPEDPVLLPW
jgi:hypothetical protein